MHVANPGDEILFVRDVEQIQAVEQGTRLSEVHVIVVEAGRHEPAVEIDDAGPVADVLGNSVIRSDEYDGVATDGDRFGTWIVVIDSPDDPVAKDEIGFLRLNRE